MHGQGREFLLPISQTDTLYQSYLHSIKNVYCFSTFGIIIDIYRPRISSRSILNSCMIFICYRPRFLIGPTPWPTRTIGS